MSSRPPVASQWFMHKRKEVDFIAYLAADRVAAIYGAELVIDGGTVRIV